jgi:hypothetical protein
MSKYFTAAEAKKLAGKSVEEKVELLCESIKKNASERKRSLITGWEHKEDRDLWIDGGYSRTEDWEKAKKILEALGYKVTFYCQEPPSVWAIPIVAMYTIIEW